MLLLTSEGMEAEPGETLVTFEQGAGPGEPLPQRKAVGHWKEETFVLGPCVCVCAECLYIKEGRRLDFLGEILETHRSWALGLRRMGRGPPFPQIAMLPRGA